MLMAKIAQAKMEGADSVETSPEIIAHFNRRGLNGAKYFIMDGIKVYPTGKTEEIEAEEDMPISQKVFGPSEGKFD